MNTYIIITAKGAVLKYSAAERRSFERDRAEYLTRGGIALTLPETTTKEAVTELRRFAASITIEPADTCEVSHTC